MPGYAAQVLGTFETHAKVYHCGRVWNLGNLDAKFNPRLWRYKLHFLIHHR